MSASFIQQIQTGWTRFMHGDLECTVITDGPLFMGAPHPTFIGADPQEINQLLEDNFLPTDRMALNQNILIVNTGSQLVLFDTGTGVNVELGVKTFGAQAGQALANLRAAGIDPADIDIVALTHAHPDHCWGLVDDDGQLLYPNARVAIDRRELKYWTDLSILSTPKGEAMSQHMRDHFLGAHKNLTPYVEQDRIIIVSDGFELLPGITAVSAPGHSPGHTLYKIESQQRTLLLWGDLCHHQVLLLQHPEWGFMFDFDNAAAAKTRVRVLEEVARNRYEVLSYHFPFPGRGHLLPQGDGYHWLPVELQLY
ncbi:MBL fold metallo-hydrolase [Enterobacter genomosp. O]|uniref:Zn-dependent hydrolase n=1 Tax=Enterobacter genomosp. O TaxID=2364150 RepID=A0A0X4ESZ5_9ENTR|nr:MBL fold metallo-hydrolase [Enterobacter genomosp. O]KUQ84823.1 Zn-dependent hydrolase [Enterobacter genomosp. O]